MFQPSLFDTPPQVRTVSDINAYIRHKFEADLNLQDVWLEGEISNWKQAASGHIYFTLKDPGASIRCVIWRSQAQQLVYMPQQEGEAILAHGKISVYEAGGNYQFYVDDLEPLGQGSLHAQFERIKAELADEGLFDAELKQPLPQYPRQIGIVTSSGAAALRDILNVLRRRYPVADVILSPTPVQGDNAPPQIIAALEAIAQQPVDVIILARGGGSLEDLWAFNSKELAYAIANCHVPVVSGVGHETDFTIADFVADVRAPTPSAAAELVSPDRVELKRLLADVQFTLEDLARLQVDKARNRLQGRQWALERMSPQAQINNHRQRVDTLLSNATTMVEHRFVLKRQKINALSAQLTTLDPSSTLERGYAIVQKGTSVVTETGQVEPGNEIVVKVKDGQFDAVVGKQ